MARPKAKSLEIRATGFRTDPKTYDTLLRHAAINRRSLNAEINFRLAATLKADKAK